MDDQQRMLDIWQNIFKTTVTSESDFFDDLEGDSMAAAAIVHWVKIVFGVQIPMVEVFDQPTPAELTAYVDTVRSAPAK
ncbi:acyl carrier protein [Micromonospora sp. R77]|uniref:acyl carrier protein n=1 Tax=Micromonospora sp. R77 TaxID=2925836 RepID=UPI001F602740|nr:acyl carrier protein [Micromonospora sp. R77]MCI4066449.1 acyl carrier protein [Micromonospora sp. R77]